MSPEFRRQFESVIDDYYEQLVTTISEARKLDRQKVRQLIDQGLFTAKQAKDAGLIDRVVYDDQLAKDLAGQLKTDEVAVDQGLRQEGARRRFLGHRRHDEDDGDDDGRRPRRPA